MSNLARYVSAVRAATRPAQTGQEGTNGHKQGVEHPHVKERPLEPQERPLEAKETLLELVEWFLLASGLPRDPFTLKPGVHVTNPGKFYRYLVANISQEPQGPRAKSGALREDLQALKEITEEANNG